MDGGWVGEELREIDLADKRLNRRLATILTQLATSPSAGIPQACGNRSELTAAYRFFANPKTTFHKILKPHIRATCRRIEQQPKVILVQDTTEIDLTRPEQQVRGVGPLDRGSRRGFLLHPQLAFSAGGTPLGVVGAKLWKRVKRRPSTRTERKEQRRLKPLPQKESFRWVQAQRTADRLAQEHPATRFVTVADSEADFYEMLVESQRSENGADWIVRAGSERVLGQGPTGRDESLHYVRDRLMASPVRFVRPLEIRARKAKIKVQKSPRKRSRPARSGCSEVRATRVTLRGVARPGGKLPDLTVNAVLIREIAPPKGEVPVDWLLMTSLPIDAEAELEEVISTYCVRWLIEVYFRTLKTGCRLEKRRFETGDRLQSCLAVYLIVTWRTLYVCHLGRECPKLSCEALFEPAEWKSVYYLTYDRLPKRGPPQLRTFIPLLAQFGGYVKQGKPRVGDDAGQRSGPSRRRATDPGRSVFELRHGDPLLTLRAGEGAETMT
jgi:hypothetical protein